MANRLRKTRRMKGTGFRPYIAETKQWALATEGSVFGRENCYRGLKAVSL
jgi:hypothetical protein